MRRKQGARSKREVFEADPKHGHYAPKETLEGNAEGIHCPASPADQNLAVYLIQLQPSVLDQEL